MSKPHNSQFANPPFPFPSHPKTRGQIAENLFIVAALLRGFIVAKVEGDNAPFDVFLAAGLANYRIQIKSAWKSSHGGYQFVSARSRSNVVPGALVRKSGHKAATSSHSKVSPYLPGETDFIAAYLAPDRFWQGTDDREPMAAALVHGTWFIIPAVRLAHIKSLHLRSSARARSKYAPYRNAWRLLEWK